jgi:mycoredoxin
MRLEGALARAGVEYQRRNIWEDDEAAAFVRSVNNGNETVPTVVIGDEYLTNPSTATVLSKLGVEPPPSSGIGRLIGR